MLTFRADIRNPLSKFHTIHSITWLIPHHIREDILLKIFDIQFNGVRKLLDKQGIGITITDDARKMLAHKGFTPKYGARQVAGVIRNYLRRPISRLIINEELGKGKSLEVGLDEQNELTWNIHQ